MSHSLRVLFVAAALFSLASASTYKKCYNAGERCVGAPGKPKVAFLGCCGDLACSARDKSYGGYGLLCEKKKGHKCYKEGERCIGAIERPSVPYLGCCGDMTCSAKDESYGGYGLFCEKKEGPKCYKEGERCIGASGKPRVQYFGCCGDMICTAKDNSYGGYGFLCEKKKKCVAKGKECSKGGGDCCGYNKCIQRYGKYAYECGMPRTTPPVTTTTTKKCIAKGEECSKGKDDCCGYNKCFQRNGKYTCECGMPGTTPPPTTTTTTTTTEKCQAAGKTCGEYSRCCKGTTCRKPKKYTYGQRCMTAEEY